MFESTPTNEIQKEKMGFKSLIGGNSLIGMDLFTGVYSHNADGQSRWDSTEGKRPRFLVVAANGYGIGRKEAYSNNPTPNQTSILSVLFWPSTQHLSYYSGGDGHPAVERDLIVPFLGDKPVTVIKLDHHGSSGELLGTRNDMFSEATVTGMNPKKVIVTPGAEYGHPSEFEN